MLSSENKKIWLCALSFNRDVSRGRENIPIAVINGTDDDPVPTDFQYITENVETTNLNINCTINSLQVGDFED